MNNTNTQDPPLTPEHNLRLAILSARRLATFLDEQKLPIDNPIVQDELKLLNRRLGNPTPTGTQYGFGAFWEHYPAFAPYGVAEPSEENKILAKAAWDASRSQTKIDASNVAVEFAATHERGDYDAVSAGQAISHEIRGMP